MSRFLEFLSLASLSEILVSAGNANFERLDEGKWIKGQFSIRIDQPTHGAGQIHAHVYGRKGDVIGVINQDGSSSHGAEKCRLSDADADALRARGFQIKANNIVEWMVLAVQPGLLFE